jgi:hypothetical protein
VIDLDLPTTKEDEVRKYIVVLQEMQILVLRLKYLIQNNKNQPKSMP